MNLQHPCRVIALILFFVASLSAASESDVFLTVSGRVVPLHALRRHLPQLSHTAWPHLLFEQNVDGHVVSHHARLDVQRIAPFTRTIDQNALVSNPLNDGTPYPAHANATTIRSGNGYTFAYDAHTQRLIAAWGPALQLHPLDYHRHPGLFLNAAARTSYMRSRGNNSYIDRVALALSRTLRYAKTSKRKSPMAKLSQPSTFASTRNAQNTPCKRILFLNLTMEYDTAFKEMYLPKLGQSFIGLLEHVRPLFEDVACVRPSLQSYTHRSDSNKFSRPEELKICAASKSCRTSHVMLRHLLTQAEVTARWYRDAVFLFTGYNDDTKIAGASYRAAACNDQRALAWVEEGSATVFAHELGHMLGAPHDEEGIMKPTVGLDEPLTLSKSSEASIIRFVERDPRSWCLRRVLTGNKFPSPYSNGWVSCNLTSIPIRTEGSIADATMASLVSDHTKDLVAIFQAESHLGVNLTFTVSTEISSGVKKCETKNPFFPINPWWAVNSRPPLVYFPAHLVYPSGTFGFGVAFGHIQDAASKDVIVSDVQKSGMGTKVSYKVGYNMPADGSPPSSWSLFHTIPGYTAENIVCASITLGHIKSTSSNDLLHMHIEQNGLKNIAFYRIGFDIGPDGTARGGWTEKFHVEGWYGRITSSVSVALYDVDKNGQPEIIMTHEDQTPHMKRGFIRVGRNVNKDGLVTGGWSEFIEVAQLNYEKIHPTLAIDVANLGDKHPTVVAASYEIRNVQRIRLDINSELLTPRLLDTCKKQAPLKGFFEGCGECYTSKNAQRCRNEVSLCDSKIDEVWLSDGDQTSARNSKIQDSRKQGRLSTSHSSVRDVNNLESAVPHLYLEKRTAYCEGFHYLLQTKGGCFVIDRAVVIAEGLRHAFLNALCDEDRTVSDVVSSEVMDEDPAGTNGQQREPISVSIDIDGKDDSYKSVIWRAISKLRISPSFRNVPWDKVHKSVKCYRKKCYVLFKFPKGLAKEI